MTAADGKRSIYCGELFKKIKMLPLYSKYCALWKTQRSIKEIQKNTI
jgi:hypothetical protein